MLVKKQQAAKNAPGSATDAKPKEEDTPPQSASEDVAMADADAGDANDESGSAKRFAWEHVDEIMSLLKTAFPLLTLSMETMVDQILHKLKPSTDEDIYRLIVALMNDGVQVR